MNLGGQMNKGYFRFPTIYKDTIVFVSEDDLWSVPITGGRAQRLTDTSGLITSPCFSPDGKWLAFSGHEEGAREIYLMPSQGGEIKRLTYLGGIADLCGFSSDGRILFNSAAKSGVRIPILMSIRPETGEPINLNLGEGTSISISEKGSVIERNSHRPDPAHWKRYRGGTAGQLWTAQKWNGDYTQIHSELNGNLAAPQIVGDRLFFLSDHEGWGNVYSSELDGSDLKQHTMNKEFYARNLKSDGERLVYHAGANIYCLDPKTEKNSLVEVECFSQRTQTQRKFVDAKKYWQGYEMSPDGKKTCFGTRGQVFAFENWSGATLKFGDQELTRYRVGCWLYGSETLVVISDEKGVDQIDLFDYKTRERKKTIRSEFGLILKIKAAPTKNKVALINNRNELILVDVDSGDCQVIAQNRYDFMFSSGFAWSPDSRWLAFGNSVDKYQQQIQVYSLKDKSIKAMTRCYPTARLPSFDPSGRYLYFVSGQKLKPTYSDMTFDLSFIESHVPCLVTLKKDTLSPFRDRFEETKEVDGHQKEKNENKEPVHVEIDFEGIEHRMQSFPTEPRILSKVIGGDDDKVFYLSQPAKGSEGFSWGSEPEAITTVTCYDFRLQKEETYLENVTDFDFTIGNKYQTIQVRSDLIVRPSGKQPDLKTTSKECNAKTGQIDLNRVKVLVDPPKEWRQIFGEVWRLQKEFYWDENMARLNWQKVYEMYEPLLERVSSRSELSDLVWEVQGELGTSHAYEIGGDTKTPPNYPLGFLGADFKLNGEHYEILKIFDGELTGANEMAPLLQPGLNLDVGDKILTIDGLAVDPENSPESRLLHKAGVDVEVKVRRRSGEEASFTLRTLNFMQDQKLRYQDWVEANRSYVHSKTKGKVGYVHIPDMSAAGYCEFFRNYLRESDKDGLVVDARYNGGGHVSQLILRYLSQSRIGFDKTRWIGSEPYPAHSPAGPIVALTNRYAGSDGDIFPHAFKLMNLGPVIGTRTWGGVIGIYPRNVLADGGITTQPEFSFWFKDVGWKVENYGTDPDIVVEKTPQDFLHNRDPQLDCGIAEVLKRLESQPAIRPSWTELPDLSRHMNL